MNAEATFRAKAPGVMAKLLSDFPITPLDAAAILGNLGHESLGFTALQEFKPVVEGSRGGWGWAQWTGPRRRAFEAYCKRTGKDPASDEANYAWLFLELKGIEGTEGKAIAKTVAAQGLHAKVEAFEKAFLRAGVKHYPSRKLWAERALDAWQKAGSPTGPYPIPPQDDIPHYPEPAPARPAKPKSGIPGWLALAIMIALLAAAFFFLPIIPR